MTNSNTVEFETVHRRFEEAVEALKLLSKLMGGLHEAEKVKERTAAAISDASDRLRETSTTLASYCELLRSAVDSTLQALQSAENLATGAELTAIRTEVASIQNKIDGDLAEAQRSRDSALTELTEAKNRLDTLETRLSGLPPRVRRKYDLDSL